jgi:hypothetical protein
MNNLLSDIHEFYEKQWNTRPEVSPTIEVNDNKELPTKKQDLVPCPEGEFVRKSDVINILNKKRCLRAVYIAGEPCTNNNCKMFDKFINNCDINRKRRPLEIDEINTLENHSVGDDKEVRKLVYENRHLKDEINLLKISNEKLKQALAESKGE